MSEPKRLIEDASLTLDETRAFYRDVIIPDIIRTIEAGPIAGKTLRRYMVKPDLFEIRIFDCRRKGVEGHGK